MLLVARWRTTRAWLLLRLLFCVSLLAGGENVEGVESDRPKSYEGHHVVRLKPRHDRHIELLNSLQAEHGDQMEFWRPPTIPHQNVDVRLSPEVVPGILPLFNESGLLYDVMTRDIESLVTAERRKRSVAGNDDGNDDGDDDDVMMDKADNFSLSSYHTFDEISDWMDSLMDKCKPNCDVFSIGDTYEGRPMKVIRIGKESVRRPAIWIDAALHAREWIAPATAVYIISKLINQDKSDRIARILASRYTWYILPVANPDGYHYTWTMDRLWRKTRSQHPYSPCRGVDANRNWDFHWGGEGTSDMPCNEDYRGEEPFSEPETRNIARFLLTLQGRLAVYLSLHSYGQFWLTPWGYTYKVPKDYPDMIHLGTKATEAMRRTHGSRYQVGSSARLLYLASGGSDDWAKGVLGVKYSYTVELCDTGRHGFILPPHYITTTGDEMLEATRSLSLSVLRERRRAARKRKRFT